MHRRSFCSGIFFLSLGTLLHAAQPVSTDKVFTGIIKGVALGGYDAVSYFSGGGPLKGDLGIIVDWGGASYRFATVANRDLFVANPEKYVPQYGGYCAYAAAKGSLAPGDPLAWTVYKDKLYINLSPAIREKWSEDIPGNIVNANINWPGLK
jgi:hypothetical protein